jgi:outer membrane protein assembly factor BamA
MKLRAVMFVLGLLMTMAPGASAQQSTTVSADERQAGTLPPPEPEPEPSLVDKARQWADDTEIIERMDGTTDGWYPRFGGIRRGSGLGGGPGYRFHMLGNVLVDLSAAFSIRYYKTVDASIRWLRTPEGGAELWTDYEYNGFPKERYFGIGDDTVLERRTSYGYQSNDFALRGILRPSSHVELEATLGYLRPHVGTGSRTEYFPISTLFTDATAPGLASQPPFVHAGVSADLDLRDAPGNPASGGFYRVAFARWDDRTGGAYDFRRIDASGSHYFPLTVTKRHVLVAHGGLGIADADADARVPFYQLPYIGGSDTVRSYMEYRFTAENVLWYGAEYQWNPMPFVSFAGFADAGRAARTWSGLGGADTKTGYGIGVIGHTSKQTLGRIDLAFGGDERFEFWFDIGF